MPGQISNMNESTFTTQVLEDEDGNLVLEFPEDLLEAMGWEEGTMLNIDVFAGRIVLWPCTEGDSGETSPAG